MKSCGHQVGVLTIQKRRKTILTSVLTKPLKNDKRRATLNAHPPKLETDASCIGWGAFSQGERTGEGAGAWMRRTITYTGSSRWQYSMA